MNKQSSANGKVIALGFVMLLSMPLVIGFYPDGESSQYLPEEKRALKPLPVLPATLSEWLEYPAQFQAYYQDNFGLREPLLMMAKNIKAQVGIDPVWYAIVGEKGWLFLDLNNLVEENRGALPLDTSELNRVSFLWNQLSRNFEERGIQFIHFTAPEKQSIYPEYLPARVKQVGPSRLDQIRAELSGSRNYVDVKPSLINAKMSGEELYYKLDFHWNCGAAYLAYREVITNGVNTGDKYVPLVPQSDFALRDVTPDNIHDYLSARFWRSGLFSKDTSFECLLERDPLIEMRERVGGERIETINGEKDVQEEESFKGTRLYKDWIATNRNPNVRHKAIVLRDSFVSYLVPYFNRSFSEVLYIHYDTIQPARFAEEIRTFDPDFVIFEYAERHLSTSQELTKKIDGFEKLLD